MAIRSDIPKSAGWFRFEQKTIVITVLDEDGAPVALNTSDLLWSVLRMQNSQSIYLQKVSGTPDVSVGGAGHNIVTISIADDDYDDLPSGIHYQELWNSSSHLLLTYGDAYVHPSRGPVVAV